jgi:hypothetical protein
LGKRWMRDAGRVYAQGETAAGPYFYVVELADVESFEAMNLRYGRDKAAVYYVTEKRCASRSAAALAIVPETHVPVAGPFAGQSRPAFDDCRFARDREVVYCEGSVLRGADAARFRQVPDSDYYTDGLTVWFRQWPLAGADPDTFCSLPGNAGAACDKRSAYRRQHVCPSSEAFGEWSTYFDTHPELSGWWWHVERERRLTPAALFPLGAGYWTDGQHVLAEKRGRQMVLDGETPALFEVLEYGYARGHRVFRCGLGIGGVDTVTIDGADAASFAVLATGRWSRDHRRVWYDGIKPVAAQLASFEVLDEAYARDARGLIFEGVRKKVEAPDEVVGLGGGYARMRSNILWQGKPVRTGALDAATARSLGHALLIDAHGHWMLRGQYRKPMADGPTFRHLDGTFFADASRVFHLDFFGLRLVAGADPTSFRATGTHAGTDASSQYNLDPREADA